MAAPFRFCPVCGSPLEPRILRVGEPTRLVVLSKEKLLAIAGK
mgnify:CR=1 FL=1